MRRDVRIRKIEGKMNTTQFKLLGQSPPTDNFYVNKEVVSSPPFDTNELLLSISDNPFAEGEVALAFPPLPFFREFRYVVRYEHRIERRGKERRAPSTPDLGVVQVYMHKAGLEQSFISERKPIYFGLSAVHELDPGDAIAAFDGFLRGSIGVKDGSRLTSRRIWAVWAARWGADSGEDVIAGVRFADVARRFHTIYGVIMVKKPTRIDGKSQRYWEGFTITTPSA